jgi:tetratricopeptide (TPR) repeat protein
MRSLIIIAVSFLVLSLTCGCNRLTPDLEASASPASGSLTRSAAGASASPTKSASPPPATGQAASSADEAILAVNDLMSHRQFAEADTLATASLRKYPGNYQLLVNRGSVLMQLGKWDGARKDFTNSLAAAPPEARWTILSQRARCAYELGQSPQAEKDFAEAARLMGADPQPAAFAEQLWRLRGNNLNRQRHFKEAVPCFSKALKIQPDNPEAMAGRAYAHHELKEEKAYRADLAAVAAMDPSIATALEQRLAGDPGKAKS